MNIVVCIKQVPDVPAIRIDRRRMTVIRDGVESIINPLDRVALEGALHIRDREGGWVVVVTMGPPQSEEALREAIAAGADEAILLTDPAFAGADTLATSHVLAAAIGRIDPAPDLVMCGMQTIDSDTGQVGPQIAEELDMPQVCGVSEIHVEDGALVLTRVGDGFLDTVRADLPALLTVARELCPVKDLALGSLEEAFSNTRVIRWGRDDLGLDSSEVGFEGSATRVFRLRPPPPKREGEVVAGSAKDLCETLIHKLEALSILDEDDGNE